MTSSPHGPYGQGYTRTTMAGTKGSDAARQGESRKAGLSPDWSLQLGSMKLGIASIVGSGIGHGGLPFPGPLVTTTGPGHTNGEWAGSRESKSRPKPPRKGRARLGPRKLGFGQTWGLKFPVNQGV